MKKKGLGSGPHLVLLVQTMTGSGKRGEGRKSISKSAGSVSAGGGGKAHRAFLSGTQEIEEYQKNDKLEGLLDDRSREVVQRKNGDEPLQFG